MSSSVIHRVHLGRKSFLVSNGQTHPDYQTLVFQELLNLVSCNVSTERAFKFKLSIDFFFLSKLLNLIFRVCVYLKFMRRSVISYHTVRDSRTVYKTIVYDRTSFWTLREEPLVHRFAEWREKLSKTALRLETCERFRNAKIWLGVLDCGSNRSSAV